MKDDDKERRKQRVLYASTDGKENFTTAVEYRQDEGGKIAITDVQHHREPVGRDHGYRLPEYIIVDAQLPSKLVDKVRSGQVYMDRRPWTIGFREEHLSDGDSERIKMVSRAMLNDYESRIAEKLGDIETALFESRKSMAAWRELAQTSRHNKEFVDMIMARTTEER